MYEDDEMMQPLEEEAAAGCNHEMECEIQQSLDELQVQLESSDTEEEQVEQSPIRAELRQQYHALSLIGWRKRQKTINRKLRMKRRIAASKFVSPSLEYGSLNYPDDMDSDNDEQSKIFFNDEPKLYRKLLKWNPETPAPRALKEWRDALNIDFGNDRHLPPLYRFFRIFLNRQLGGRKHKMVRIQHYYGHRLVNYEMAPHVECVAPAPSECSDNGSNISFKQWRCEDGVEQGRKNREAQLLVADTITTATKSYNPGFLFVLTATGRWIFCSLIEIGKPTNGVTEGIICIVSYEE